MQIQEVLKRFKVEILSHQGKEIYFNSIYITIITFSLTNMGFKCFLYLKGTALYIFLILVFLDIIGAIKIFIITNKYILRYFTEFYIFFL